MHGLMAFCHKAGNGGYIGSHWVRLFCNDAPKQQINEFWPESKGYDSLVMTSGFTPPL
jgi:hypothetical protein